MTSFRFLLDENIPHSLRAALNQKLPEVVVWCIGDPGAPAKGTPDADILQWCENNAFILITLNRASIPNHVKHHLNQGKHFPGIFTLSPSMTLKEIVEELHLICATTTPEEFTDLLLYLPIT